jgi:hypothetical protein
MEPTPPIDPKDPARLKLRAAARLVGLVLAALAAEEATLAQLGAPAWLVALLGLAAGWLALRQPGTLPVATLAVLLLISPAGCAHLPTVSESARTAEAATIAAGMVVERLDSEDARKAEAALEEIADLLELVRKLAPTIDAEIAAREAEAKP